MCNFKIAYELVLPHLLCVEIGDEEGDIVSGDSLAPQDDEALRPLHQKGRELFHEDGLDVVALLDAQGEPDRVHRALDENPLLFRAADPIKKNFKKKKNLENIKIYIIIINYNKFSSYPTG